MDDRAIFHFMNKAHKISGIRANDRSNNSEITILDLLNQYADFVIGAGRPVFREGRQEALRILRSISEAKKIQTVQRLTSDLALFHDLLTAGEKITDSPRLMWRYLTKNSMVPRSDIFEKMKDGDVVEIYGMDQVHLCQNLNFFNWTSISLERIFCETWYQATRRDPQFETGLYETARSIFAGETRNSVTPQQGWYWIEEIDSEKLYKFQICIKCVSPIFQDGKVCGLISVNECRDLTAQDR
jgi:hypothetical protein